jgi:uncharacterized protein
MVPQGPEIGWNQVMRSSPHREVIEKLSESECLELLDRKSVGRIALTIDGRPEIFPVNYSINGRIIALRTGVGALIEHAPATTVAFEIDDYETAAGSGWSVVVQGVAHNATDSFDDVSWAARGASPLPLAPGAKPFWVAIEPTRITGRRFVGVGSER